MKSKRNRNFQLYHCHWEYCVVSVISFKGSIYRESLAPSKGWSPFGVSWIALDLWLTTRTIPIPFFCGSFSEDHGDTPSSVVHFQKIVTIPPSSVVHFLKIMAIPPSSVVHFLKIITIPLFLWFIFRRMGDDSLLLWFILSNDFLKLCLNLGKVHTQGGSNYLNVHEIVSFHFMCTESHIISSWFLYIFVPCKLKIEVAFTKKRQICPR